MLRQKVLIHGAAGGVGSFAVQFAKNGGLLVAATCGTANVTYVRSLGADRVIDYKTEDVCQAVREWSAEGVDVVLDAVGPATLPQALDMFRPGGRARSEGGRAARLPQVHYGYRLGASSGLDA
jgi:NADPH2:quinone reductase